MRKILIGMIVTLLALPAAGHAGSASSRWDLTIGGNIKFDMGWSDQSGGNSGSDMWVSGIPARNTSGTSDLANKYGAQLWGAGETSLNMFVKGPETWGAKSHAFIAGDFTGFWGAAQGTTVNPGNSYNTFNLLIAEMGFDWSNTSLNLGVSGAFFGEPMTFANSVSWNALNFGSKGPAPVVPQVTVTQRLGKSFTVGFGVMSPTNTINQLQQASGPNNDNNSGNPYRNPMPAFEGKVAYSSDACGKVGPWQLLVEWDGFWGQIRNINTDLSHKDTDQWYTDLKFLIPIIPEKNGNKAMALYGDAAGFWTQGGGQIGNWLGNSGGDSFLAANYERGGAGSGDWHAHTLVGLYTHAQFYFTDAISINGWWCYTKVNASQARRTANPDSVVQVNQYIANLQYDVNPAVRFTLEWEYTVARFAAAHEGFKNDGTNNAYRLAAYYFF